jgi:tRNA-specific 2-thiouridylase
MTVKSAFHDAVAVTAKLRSAAPPVPATLRAGADDEAELELAADRRVAPGQAAVLYDGGRVLGGGWIRPDT